MKMMRDNVQDQQGKMVCIIIQKSRGKPALVTPCLPLLSSSLPLLSPGISVRMTELLVALFLGPGTGLPVTMSVLPGSEGYWQGGGREGGEGER